MAAICCNLLEKYLMLPVLPDDEPADRSRKRFIMMTDLVVGVVCCLLVVVTHLGTQNTLGYVGFLTVSFTCIVSAIYLTYTKNLSQRHLECLTYIAGLCLCLLDWSTAATLQDRVWPMFVLVVDILLVCRAPERATRIIVGLLSLWLGVTSIEDAFRFGLYDTSLTASKESVREQFDCDSPPCPDAAKATRNFIKYLLVFLLDFYFTRGFAHREQAEKSRMQSSIKTAQDVAEALAAFDLEEAGQKLALNPDLPDELRDAFTAILENLECYRPFLPETLFSAEHSRTGSNVSPGVESGQAAIVFTDIQGSTATWDMLPDDMRTALRQHNLVIRTCISANRGYEVKTIGDAFMVAFEFVQDAMAFAVQVQEELLSATWPSGLSQAPDCRSDSEGMWAGLRVRIGVNCGEVVVESNSLTGRLDYFGTTVNKAARAEQAGAGGGITVTAEVMKELREQEFVVAWEGDVKMKGLRGEPRVFILVPQHLKGRVPGLRSVAEKRQQNLRTRDMNKEARGENEPPNTVLMESVNRGRDSQAPSLTSRRRSSGWLSESTTVPFTGISEKILDISIACICFRLLDASFQVISSRLERLHACLHRTSGAVVSLLATRVTVGWNLNGTNPTHYQNCMRFVALLDRTMLRGGVREASLGLATGTASCGTLGTNAARFATAAGECVALVGPLSEAAVRFETLALFADLDRNLQCHSHSSIKVSRPVGYCSLVNPEETTTDIVIYELNRSCLEEFIDIVAVSPLDDPTKNVPWSWSQQYWHAFAGNHLDELMRRAVEDPKISVVHQHLSSGQHLLHPVYC